jgi:hypothetical protein
MDGITMRRIHDDSQANLIELLAREHRTVESLVEDLAFLDTDDVDHQCDLYLALQGCARASKAQLIDHLMHH